MVKQNIILTIFIFFTFFGLLYSQSPKEEYLESKRNFDISGMDKSLSEIDEGVEKELANYLLLFYKFGIDSLDNFNISTYRDKSLSPYSKVILGSIVRKNEVGEDSLSYAFLNQAVKESKELNDTLLVNESFSELNRLFLYAQFEINNRKAYLDESKQFIRDDIDQANYALFYLSYLNNIIPNGELDSTQMLPMFNESLSVNSNFHKGKLYNCLGTYYDVHMNDYEKSRFFYEKAIKAYDTDTSFIYQSQKINTLHNLGIIQYFLKDYSQAQKSFEYVIKHNKNRPVLQHSHEWLSKTFEATNQIDLALFHFKKMRDYEQELSLNSFGSKILNNKREVELELKEAELVALLKQKGSLKSQLYMAFPIALLALIVAIFIYRKYIKTSKEKSIIEEEHEIVTIEKQKLQNTVEETSERLKQLHSENKVTHQKIDELKKVVTKEFIILKDKTKVYVEELMLIQSDDHYLKVKLDGKKDNFVRGKLTKILTELPPNFKRCHRSYIVNENYIQQFSTKSILLTDKTEVPVSTTYRDQFKEFNN